MVNQKCNKITKIYTVHREIETNNQTNSQSEQNEHSILAKAKYCQLNIRVMFLEHRIQSES